MDGLAIDSQRLSYINKQDPKNTSRSLGTEFEALFFQLALKSMREATRAVRSDLFNDQATDMYDDFFDQQLSLVLAKNSNLGVEQHISNYIKAANSEKTGAIVNHTTTEQPNFQPKTLKKDFKDQNDFIKHLTPLLEVARDKGFDPKAILAQAALETGWGEHIPFSNGKGFNLFGIKADPSWEGDVVRKATTEFRDGLYKKEHAKFRGYASFSESINDYMNFLESNPRYNEALQVRNDPHKFAGGLQKAGYATDPNYANKLSAIINSIN